MNTTRLGRQFFWGIGLLLLSVTVVPFARMRIKGRKNIPRTGPVLILGNHTTLLDPVLVYWSSRRRVHGVGSDQFMKVPILGPLMTWFSVIPFSKGSKDRGAMAEISKRSAEGACILLFPEGNRSWTGRFQPIKDSNGRLAKRLACPVVCARFDTGHLHWPRWATYPRFLPVHIEYLPAHSYGPELSDGEVTEHLVDQMTIEPDEVTLPRWSWGFRLAWGLPKLLWACPHCYSLGGVELVPSDSDRVHCPACEATWRVDLACAMKAAGGPAEDTTVDRAWHRMLDHFGALPVVDPARFEAEGVALECASLQVLTDTRSTKEAEPLGHGRARLFADRLCVDMEDGPLELAFADVGSVIIQLGDKLQIRMAEQTYELHPTGQSIHMWKHFLGRHLAAFRAGAGPAA